MKEKVYKIEMVVTDEETGKEVKGHTYSHWHKELKKEDEYGSVFEDLYRILFEKIEKEE